MASITSLSAIVVTGLTAKSAVVGAVPLTWSYTTPPGQGCLSYMLPASFEIYRGTTNSFAAVTTVLIGTSPTALFTDTSPLATAAFYFLVAIDPNGYRSVPTAGVSATAAPAAATTTALDAAIADYTAQIVEEASNRQSADGALQTSLNGVQATATDALSKANLGTASGTIGFQAGAAPSGFTAAFQLMARVTTAAVLRAAGIAADVTSTLARLRLIGDSIVIQDSSGNIFPLFSNGKIAVDRLSAGIINAASLFLNGVQVVATGSIATNAVTTMAVTGLTTYGANTNTNPTNVGTIKSAGITVTDNASVLIRFTAQQDVPTGSSANFGTYVLTLKRGGTTLLAKSIPYDDNFANFAILEVSDTPGNGAQTYTVDLVITPNGGLAQWNLKDMQIVLQQFKR